MIDGPGVVRRAPDLGHRADHRARSAAPRADSYDYRVEWAPGAQPPAYPATDTWTTVAGQAG